MPDSPALIGPRSYKRELARLQGELVRLQCWIQERGVRVAVLFEGRNAAGKGGVIRQITHRTSKRVFRTVALPKPTERERGEWYFQRYVAHLPAAGELALFDRSWYNRAGVERVMGFCSPAEVERFYRDCPRFERLLVDSGMRLIKYWFELSEAEQERRFEARRSDARKVWKLSEIDLAERLRFDEYAGAFDAMFGHCHTAFAPWHVVDADHKPLARLNCIRHLLAQLPYEDLLGEPAELPPRPKAEEVAVRLPPRIPARYRWSADA